MLDDFPTIAEQQLHAEVATLKTLISDGEFSAAAGNTFNISADALIKLSEEVETTPSAERPRPVFDFMISPDPLTIRVANRIYKPLKEMGFNPVFLVAQYKVPTSEPKHEQLGEYTFQNQVFNQVVLPTLSNSASNVGQFLTPGHLAQAPQISKLFSGINSVNDPEIRSYVGSPEKSVGIVHTFRLYNRVGRPFIENFSQVSQDGKKTQWGEGAGHVKSTCFTSPYFHEVHSKQGGKIDNGQRRGLVTNIHPSIQHHGIIPPFWQQYHMLKLMEKLGIDHEDHTAQEIADICVQYSKDNPEAEDRVDPYLNGMIHHIEPRFDTGDRILIAQNKVPIDLGKPVWENYFAMEEMIVKSTLALAAAYKLGLNLKGQEQELQKTTYHSYPGPDSSPPSYMSDEAKKAILENDVPALDDFQRLGGKISSKKHFHKIIFGDPETGTPGFVIPGTALAARVEERIDEAYSDRKVARNSLHHKGTSNDNVQPPAADQPSPGQNWA